MAAVPYYATTGVAGGGFATGKRLAQIKAELAAAGVDDVSLEIVSGVLVGVGFSIDAETVEQAEERGEEALRASSLERVGPLKMAVPATM
jgi:hypothetical protein